MSSDVRIDVLTDAIKQLPQRGEIKDALADDLKFAQDINGTTDPAYADQAACYLRYPASC